MKRTMRLFPVVLTLAVASAYASTINNPGSISYTSNSDSKVVSLHGLPIYTNLASGESISGTIDSSGAATFLQANIKFDPSTDANGYTAQLEPTGNGTGGYCPNSGAATINFPGRIKITKVAGVSLSNPCYLVANSGGDIKLTTGTSGGLTGTPFTMANPKFVTTLSFLATATGNCTSAQKLTINSYYGASNTVTTIQLFAASISPTNFTGDGC